MNEPQKSGTGQLLYVIVQSFFSFKKEKGDERFRGISNDAKILYGLMLDRMSLSMKNGWFDELNRTYIIYTLEQVAEDLGCSTDKCTKVLAELDSKKGIGLIERVRRGQGKADIIYIKNFVSMVKENKNPESVKSGFKTPQKTDSRKRKTKILESAEFGRNYTDSKNNDSSDTEKKTSRSSVHPVNPSDAKKIETIKKNLQCRRRGMISMEADENEGEFPGS